MERKLIRQGGGGYTIYLPKQWIDKKGLDSGSLVHITETETSLVITSDVVQRRTAKVEITSENRSDLRNILTHLYRRGFDSITLKGIDAKLAKEVERTTHDLLLGFEITERTGGQYTIENISEPSEQKYDLLLKRIFLILRETHNVAAAEIEHGQFGDEVELLRKQQDKYLLFCRRSLIRERETRPISTQWELLTFLMHIEHAYYYLHKYAREHKVKATSRITDLLRETGEYLDLYYNSFYKQDMASIHAINARRDDLIFGKCYEYMLAAKGHEAVLISHFRELLRLIQVGMSPILSELLQAKLT